MNMKTTLRIISLGMLAAAVIFVLCAVSNPTLGSTICIGNFKFGVEQWWVCYKLYALVMVCLFAASFFVKRK